MKKSCLIFITLLYSGFAFGSETFLKYCENFGSNGVAIDNVIESSNFGSPFWPMSYDRESCLKSLEYISQVHLLALRIVGEASFAAYEGNRDVMYINAASTTFINDGKLGTLPSLKEFKADGISFEGGLFTGFSANQPIETINIRSLDAPQMKLPILSKLKTFSIFGSDLSSVESLAGQPNLETIHLGYTAVKDLRPLLTCPKLKIVSLAGTERNAPGIYELVKKGVRVYFFEDTLSQVSK